MVGKRYIYSKLGVVEVIIQPNYEAGGPRNVMVKTIKGKLIVVPQRSLRKLKEIIMKRHQNKWLALSNGTDLDSLIDIEIYDAVKKFGPFASSHELVAVLWEELEEFWKSVKARDPDPHELLQVCAVAKRGIIELCQQARDEMKIKEAQI